MPPGILADWLEQQGSESWWSVDGDPTLEQSVNFPCDSDTLADDLRARKELLLVGVPEDAAWSGDAISSAEDLDAAVQTDEHGNRVLELRWSQQSYAQRWILCEDKGIARIARSATQGAEHAATAD